MFSQHSKSWDKQYKIKRAVIITALFFWGYFELFILSNFSGIANNALAKSIAK